MNAPFIKVVVTTTVMFLLSCTHKDQSHLTPPRVISNSSSIEEHPLGSRKSVGKPAISVSKKGKLWAVWYERTTLGSDSGSYVVVASGGEGGEKWKKELIIDPEKGMNLRIIHPQIWVDPVGKLWIFLTQQVKSPISTDSGVWTLTTDDPDANEPVWSTPLFITDGILTGKPVLISGGECILPVAGRKGAEAVVTSDHGKSWLVRGVAKCPPNEPVIEEQSIIERKDSSLWMFIRTPQGIWESRSADKGHSWSSLKSSSFQGMSEPFFIRRLLSGNLLLVRQVPDSLEPASHSLMAFVSKDEGKTWIGGLRLNNGPGISEYPDGQQIPNPFLWCCGKIYILFLNRENECSEQQIVLTRFKEDDVILGSGDPGKAPANTLVSISGN